MKGDSLRLQLVGKNEIIGAFACLYGWHIFDACDAARYDLIRFIRRGRRRGSYSLAGRHPCSAGGQAADIAD